MLCPAVAGRQATQAGHSLDDELHLLTVHGVLHLLGYDHAEPAQEREMFRLQNELLDTWRDQRVGRRPAGPAGRGRRRRAGRRSACTRPAQPAIPANRAVGADARRGQS